VLPSPAGRGHAVSRVPCTGSWPARYAPIQQSACTGQRCPFTNHRPSPRAGSDRSQMRHTSGRSMVAPTPRSPHHYQTTVTPPSHQTAGMTEMFTVLQGLHSTCRPEMFRGGRPCAGMRGKPSPSSAIVSSSPRKIIGSRRPKVKDAEDFERGMAPARSAANARSASRRYQVRGYQTAMVLP
jgi:hypothetical protein